MTASLGNPDWKSPEDLAAEMGRPARWVKEQMAAGRIPSVKIGNRRYFTPECRQRLMDDQLAATQARTQGWGQVTRGRQSP